MFDLKAFTDVVVYGPIEPEDAAVTFVELHFKDQFISRGDMWLFTEAMMNLPVHRKKTFDLLGMRVRRKREGARSLTIQRLVCHLAAFLGPH